MKKTALAIETTGRVLSVALATDGGVVCRRSDGELRHLTDLIPTVRELLDGEGAELSSLSYIAVSAGPGSFTGIRIGVSAARAMAQVADLKVVKTPTLETFAYGYEPGEIVCPMLDARRGQVYCGAYRLSEDVGAIEALVPSGVRTEDEFEAALAEALSAPAAVASSSLSPAAAAVSPSLSSAASAASSSLSFSAAGEIRRVRDEDEPQSAAKVLRWAESFGELIDYTQLEPIYMRKAEAQRKLEERLAAEAANGER
ncbi:MAG: tRNA (adenosine(37)-N6)-threonylcarbamoyltransferase complex dimerization subunit type 1 TsaB [Clostridiales Family XIII bacterium]|jgi:tRNA threonylcarbamoyladenosine biosynthesis protein TsaB|nr:tRNA (adenosine(37)-N6)-threonylcarbamoyltransferase complex dimerization subunit type 1 TsaB [Clostridiales Family XIII bacterium]